MPTASEQGFVEESEFQNLEIGQQLEINGKPEFLEPTDSRKYSTVVIPTENGKMSSTSKTVIGQLKSDNPKSVGKLVEAALDKKSTLTVWVVKNVNPDNGNVGYKLSIFKPKN
ncbi:hypothetical protein HOV56_gp12 [Nitrosopumilus spindle-shaped virus]|uniref:Uncharacterized protein n=2 Tax=Nitmarvirus NSV1 TaxID=2734593 RepID=A0A514K2U5_9VIRU|nr:hypothetical protein HOV56_gp12 [Nitrosopumilus spindle-shaped virus]YP_010772841.1 hypothetical protein QIT54_gp11 [Nitrosopumilus spindle-shaped virus]YP_010772889.1 hypothetical protein QIT55_gp11 [Nitrosopumilus spindle-shaped virus]QDI73901.1 hypothetical protein [Nitrosopumilus spindle-shaped virus]QDI73949.1 hypothetical protein [Nitrosopumilus spindle-shaped virus]QDI73997.1 hypothetical protein [Nitrosopumilus spindle-shaped virus]